MNGRVGEEPVEALRRQEEQQHHPRDNHCRYFTARYASISIIIFQHVTDHASRLTHDFCLSDDGSADFRPGSRRSSAGTSPDLTISEVARALRALSSCYVERRDKLAEGGALSSAGKRAAFALFYGPQHFCIVKVCELAEGARRPSPTSVPGRSSISGCGTGAAGAAWAVAAGAPAIRGFDRHPWAVDEANLDLSSVSVATASAPQATSRRLTCLGSERDASRRRRGRHGRSSPPTPRTSWHRRAATRCWPRCSTRTRRGARILVVEPIARRSLPWWSRVGRPPSSALADAPTNGVFRRTCRNCHGQLARAAGLDPRELTARSLFL